MCAPSLTLIYLSSMNNITKAYLYKGICNKDFVVVTYVCKNKLEWKSLSSMWVCTKQNNLAYLVTPIIYISKLLLKFQQMKSKSLLDWESA